MVIKNVSLDIVCGITSKLPDTGRPEIAFAGKSNVGKSSLINGLLNRKALARTSSQPGKTQTINFYNVNDFMYLVDLPGYGYAKVPETEKAKWGKMIERYLHTSQTLKAVFLLIDIRHDPSANDKLMYDWIDPHNLGAIIRTANLAGAHGVIIPKRHAAGLTSTVAKTSAGALNYTPVAKVSNLGQTIEELKKEGMWFVCADMGGELMYNLNLTGPMGVVIGNEGEGVSRLVKEKCDFVAAIPMKGDIDSLNASVAAGILAYEVVRQRMK